MGARGEARAQWGGEARQEHSGALGCGGKMAAAQARARRIGHGGITKEDVVEWLNIPPNATEKDTEKGVLKPREIH